MRDVRMTRYFMKRTKMEREKPARDIGAKNFQNRCSQCETAGDKVNMNVEVSKLIVTLAINISKTNNNILTAHSRVYRPRQITINIYIRHLSNTHELPA